ncbi:MAG TPA: pirin family protein [Kofleriaceae bacterium]|nr:pirin family protein [Kofleriaceae bacterium]
MTTATMTTTSQLPSTSSPPSVETRRAAAREIDGIHRAPALHWVGDGFRVAGYFSAIPDAARKLSPFLLLDYHPPHDYAPTSGRRGVGVHPHRGFETVTLAWQGSVAHHDSAGGGGVIGPGDVQWMTAASGILHKEYHEERYARSGGPFQMAQLWVNLPAAHKMASPRYQGISSGQIGVATLPDGAGQVRVVAGEYRGVRGPARTFTPVEVYDARLAPGGALDLWFPARNNAAVLVMKGDLAIHGSTAAREGDLVLFANRGEHIAIEARSEAHLLVLSGEPIDEPVVQYGPFVMNSQREIVQAIDDLGRGVFGHLDD